MVETLQPHDGSESSAKPTEVVLVKLGGSLITDKQSAGKARESTIRRLAGELVQGRDRCLEAIILGHGSGSFGHVEAARCGLREGSHEPVSARGISRTQMAARRLHELVLSALDDAGAYPFSLPPSALALASSGRLSDVRIDPVLSALEHRILPVVYGDVVLDRVQGGTIVSTETFFEALARRLIERGVRVRRALWLGIDDGVYDSSRRPVETLSSEMWRRARSHTGGSEATDVTGGMRLKAETALRMARLGIVSWIGDGTLPGRLERLLAGETVPGTRVEAESSDPAGEIDSG